MTGNKTTECTTRVWPSVFKTEKKKVICVSHAAARGANVLNSCHESFSLEHKIKKILKREEKTLNWLLNEAVSVQKVFNSLSY